ncbi:MAG: tRNA lysidine(34) synthetase TilS [bacterium]|nr:tRNA lysidine(34) synthetase TilS [bacterium]MBU1919085.1 tRNA lysidine(34) synthetase TilS [bacterium]
MISLFSSNEMALLKKEPPVLLVSGGPDSIFLFHAFCELKKSHALDFEVIHFNHHLRGPESDDEQQFVKNLCKANGIKCHIRHIKLLTKTGVQEAARKHRLENLYLFQKRHHTQHFITAHHGDDVLETLVMRQERGAGLKGFTSIRRKQVHFNESSDEFVTLWRPLVNLFKEDIVQYLEKRAQQYCTDSSNQSPTYFRNRVRHDVMNKWTDLNAKKHVLTSVQKIQIFDDYFNERLRDCLLHYFFHVPIDVWNTWPDELAFRFYMIKMHENGYQEQIEQKHFEETKDKFVKQVLGHAIFLKDTAGCYFTNDHFLKNTAEQLLVIKNLGAYIIPKSGSLIILEKITPEQYDKPSNQKSSYLYLSLDNVKFPLHITRASLTEIMKPYGKGSMPLKKLFQSRRIPKFERLFWPILRDQTGKILALPGLEIGDSVRVSSKTKAILRIQYIKTL